MPKYTPAEKAAKACLAANRLQVRRLLVAEDYDGAVALAKRFGFDVFAARLPAIYNNEAEPFFQKLEIRLGIPPQPPPPFAGQAALDAKNARLAEEAKAKLAESIPAQESDPVTVDQTEQASQPVPELPPVPTGEVPPEHAPEPPPEPVQFVNGWPTTTPAKIYAFCPNKQIIIIQLPDGRRASMWRSLRHWQIHDKLIAHLCPFDSGDPMYEWVKRP